MARYYKSRSYEEGSWSWETFGESQVNVDTYSFCCSICLDGLHREGHVTFTSFTFFVVGEIVNIPVLNTRLLCIRSGDYCGTYDKPLFIKFEGIR